MIKLYKKSFEDSSTRKAIAWFQNHNIPYEIVTNAQLSEDTLKQILVNSDKGFEEIMISRNKSPKLYRSLDYFNFEEATVSEMIEFLLQNSDFMKSPIIFNNKNLVVGFNKEKMRAFMPRNHSKNSFNYEISNKIS